MPTMRLMQKADFYEELKKHGFAETEYKTEESTLWYHEESKRHFTVPHYMGEISDSILDEYLRAVGRLYQLIPTSHQYEAAAHQEYCVTEKESEKKKYAPEIIELKPKN